MKELCPLDLTRGIVLYSGKLIQDIIVEIILQ